MICYLCRQGIPDDQPFYNDHGQYVCKPCFKDAPRCFVCRFPGRDLRLVKGLGLECEFCRGHLIAPGAELAPLLAPLAPFLAPFGVQAPADLAFRWLPNRALRELQTEADLPPETFIDDFLRYAYPVYYHAGALHLLLRMTRTTFVVYASVQLAAAHLARAAGLPDLRGRTPFHSFARGWCHWIGFEAAGRLGYDLEWRQLRKWPELGAQGDFERFQAMARFQKPPQMVRTVRANLGVLARKHLAPGSGPEPLPSGATRP